MSSTAHREPSPYARDARDAHHLEADADQAYRVLVEGGLVLLRTDIGYGLVGCSAAAVARIYELKGRPRAKPCVTVANAAVFDDVAAPGDPRLRRWVLDTAARTPIAVITPLREGSALLRDMPPFVRDQATSAGTIATFHSAGRLVVALAERARLDGRVVVGSSANAAFTGNNYRLADVPASIRAGADLVLDGGEARYANPERRATTILDLVSYTVVREGINHAMIAEAWGAFRRDVLDAA